MTASLPLYARPAIFRGEQCAEARPGRRSDRAAARYCGRRRAGRWPYRRGDLGAECRRRRPREHGPASSGRPLGWWPGCPDAGRAFVTLSASSASVHASGVQCPVGASSVHACAVHATVSSVDVQVSGRPVSGGRCPVAGVRCPVSGVNVRYPCVPRPLCPNPVSSSSGAVRRQPHGEDGRSRRGRPAVSATGSSSARAEPGAGSWRRPCWASGASSWTWS
jgi:hypothetical protein